MYLKAIFDLIDPDLTYGVTTSNGEFKYSNSELLHSRKLGNAPKYTTGENNRWLLDGTWMLFPSDASEVTEDMFFIGNEISGPDGSFKNPVWVQENFSNVSILQAFSVYFPTVAYDGVPEDFTVDVYQGSTSYYSKLITGNSATELYFDGFTVYNPTAIRITVTKWSIGNRYLRAISILPGIYEEWTEDYIASIDITQEVDVSCTRLPYSSCSLTMNNISRRFEPRSKSGIFKSIQERQAIPISIGTLLEDGSTEYVPVGVFYQKTGGWTTGDNDITFTWGLVDLIGLLAERTYVPPATLPTTVEGWVSSIVSQLGERFSTYYTIADGYGAISLTCTADKVTNVKCADIILWVCQAIGAFPRVDNATGYLCIEPMWNSGNYVTLDNLEDYPTIKANSDISGIIFTLNDGNDTQYTVGGNNSAASENKTINNPFIKNTSQANVCAKNILSCYGGNIIEIKGRGNPSSECGDVSQVQLDESSAVAARLMRQQLSFIDGIMSGLTSTLLQPDGGFLYDASEVITSNGTWTAPNGVSSIKIIIVGSGTSGTDGEDGGWDSSVFGDYTPQPGTDGLGGKVFVDTININNQQEFSVSIGTGGADTVFGSYSSVSGQRYNGFSDVASGNVYARDGVQVPLPNSGDGGAGGKAGTNGVTASADVCDSEGNVVGTRTYVVASPTSGQSGAIGASGCVVVYWDKSQVIV